LIEPQLYRDERGFFTEVYQKRHFDEFGLVAEFVQDNHSRSMNGVLRGIHYQDLSAPMAKLVRCTSGRIFDVVVDLRLGSPQVGKWFGVELTEENMRQIYVPIGFGHGFVALSPTADLQYKCTGYYEPSAEGAVAWNDPDIGVKWPITDPIVSARDRRAISLRDYLAEPAFRHSVQVP
jgi:dTDP-4-dehydrorhamnose 3,5-epimerase